MEEQREIDGRSVESIIQQSLGHVQSGHSVRLAKSVEDEFVLADAVYRQ